MKVIAVGVFRGHARGKWYTRSKLEVLLVFNYLQCIYVISMSETLLMKISCNYKNHSLQFQIQSIYRVQFLFVQFCFNKIKDQHAKIIICT